MTGAIACALAALALNAPYAAVPASARHVGSPAMVSREWRLFGVEVSCLATAGEANAMLREAVAQRLAVPSEALESVTLVRRSLDARLQRAGGRRGGGLLTGAHPRCRRECIIATFRG